MKLTKRTIEDIERGDSGMLIRTLVRLADAYQVEDLNSLFVEERA